MGRRHARLALRKRVFARDGGICAKCAADCEKMRRVYFLMGFEGQAFYGELVGVVDDHKTFWDADHIREVADGGSDELENLQTLCVGCHGVKTAEFMKSRTVVRTEPLTAKSILTTLENKGIGLCVKADNVLYYECAFEPLAPEFKAAMMNQRMEIMAALSTMDGARLQPAEMLGAIG